MKVSNAAVVSLPAILENYHFLRSRFLHEISQEVSKKFFIVMIHVRFNESDISRDIRISL